MAKLWGGGSITNGTYRIVGTCHFSGVGLEAGIGSGWTFSSAWHLFSHLEGALLMGRFRGHEEHTVQQQIAYDNGSHLSRAVPNLTFDLGLSWNRSLRSLLFNAQIAYEASCFFSQNQFTHLTTGVPVYVRTPGILALQGLTLSFSLRF